MTGITFKVIKSDGTAVQNAKVTVSNCTIQSPLNGNIAVPFNFNPDNVPTDSNGEAFFDTSFIEVLYVFTGTIEGTVQAESGILFGKFLFRSDPVGNGVIQVIVNPNPVGEIGNALQNFAKWISGNLIVAVILLGFIVGALYFINKYTGGLLRYTGSRIGHALTPKKKKSSENELE